MFQRFCNGISARRTILDSWMAANFEPKSEKPEKKKEKTKVPKIESKRKMKQQQIKPKRPNAPTGKSSSLDSKNNFIFQIIKNDLFYILFFPRFLKKLFKTTMSSSPSNRNLWTCRLQKV